MGKGLRRVALGKGEDSFEAISAILACRAMGDREWGAEVPQIPQTTCLMEVLQRNRAPESILKHSGALQRSRSG